MEGKTEQTMRFTDEELRIIKNTFAENDDALKRIRKVMLQIPLNTLDLSVLELVKKESVLKILRKSFLPTLDPDAPINQVVDLWMTVQIAEKTPDEAYPHLKAREKVICYIKQQQEVLEGSRKEKIKFNELVDIDKIPFDAYVDLVARNTIISHVEMQLTTLKILAGLKDETVEEMKERLQKDSNK